MKRAHYHTALPCLTYMLVLKAMVKQFTENSIKIVILSRMVKFNCNNFIESVCSFVKVQFE